MKNFVDSIKDLKDEIRIRVSQKKNDLYSTQRDGNLKAMTFKQDTAALCNLKGGPSIAGIVDTNRHMA